MTVTQQEPDIDLETEDGEHIIIEREPYWDPITVVLGFIGAMLILGILTPDIPRAQTIIAGILVMLITSQRYVSYLVPLSPRLFVLSALTNLFFIVSVFIGVVKLITG